jgi:hypothetical protein
MELAHLADLAAAARREIIVMVLMAQLIQARVVALPAQQHQLRGEAGLAAPAS